MTVKLPDNRCLVGDYRDIDQFNYAFVHDFTLRYIAKANGTYSAMVSLGRKLKPARPGAYPYGVYAIRVRPKRGVTWQEQAQIASDNYS